MQIKLAGVARLLVHGRIHFTGEKCEAQEGEVITRKWLCGVYTRFEAKASGFSATPPWFATRKEFANFKTVIATSSSLSLFLDKTKTLLDSHLSNLLVRMISNLMEIQLMFNFQW